jgi:hypothetical protein
MNFSSLAQEIGHSITQLNADRRYWFLRTSGGRLYEPFINNSFIGIAYNLITNADLIPLKALDHQQRKLALAELITVRYPTEANKRIVWHIVGLIERFFFEMKKGDVVLIPNVSSKMLMIGEITEDELKPVSIIDQKGNIICDYHKCRSVKWIQELNRNDLNNKLFGVFYSQKAMVSLDEYGDEIDAAYNDFYKKGDDYHCILRVTNKNRIKANDFLATCTDLIDIATEYSGSSRDVFDLKTNVRSPGTIEFIGYTITASVAIWILSSALGGGKFNLKIIGLQIEAQAPGLLGAISKFLKSHPDFKEKLLKLFKDKGSLKVSPNKDFERLIDADFHVEYGKLPRRAKRLGRQRKEKDTITPS